MVEIERIDGHENARSSPELDPAKVDRLAVQVLGFTPVTNVAGAGGTAEDIWAVLGICYPARSSPVEDGITPSLDVDVEAIRVNIRYIGDYTPVFVLVHVELLQEDDNLRRGDEGAGKVDAT